MGERLIMSLFRHPVIVLTGNNLIRLDSLGKHLKRVNNIDDILVNI